MIIKFPQANPIFLFSQRIYKSQLNSINRNQAVRRTFKKKEQVKKFQSWYFSKKKLLTSHHPFIYHYMYDYYINSIVNVLYLYVSRKERGHGLIFHDTTPLSD